jgi:hypothetical protein
VPVPGTDPDAEYPDSEDETQISPHPGLGGILSDPPAQKHRRGE